MEKLLGKWLYKVETSWEKDTSLAKKRRVFPCCGYNITV